MPKEVGCCSKASFPPFMSSILPCVPLSMECFSSDLQKVDLIPKLKEVLVEIWVPWKVVLMCLLVSKHKGGDYYLCTLIYDSNLSLT